MTAARVRAVAICVWVLALVTLEAAVLWHGAVMRLPGLR